jgi:hypothetical protein
MIGGDGEGEAPAEPWALNKDLPTGLLDRVAALGALSGLTEYPDRKRQADPGDPANSQPFCSGWRKNVLGVWLFSSSARRRTFMSCLGVHFALTEKEVADLRLLTDEQARLNHLKGVIETTYFDQYPDLKAESDKAWDAMHRALADGKLTWDGGDYPLNHTVLGGEPLYTGSDYIMSLKTVQQVRDIATALVLITEPAFRRRYFAIDAKSYGFPMSEDDFGYTWESFQCVRDLYTRAAEEGRLVLFTADQ